MSTNPAPQPPAGPPPGYGPPSASGAFAAYGPPGGTRPVPPQGGGYGTPGQGSGYGAPPQGGGAKPPPQGPENRGDWSLSWHGVRTVAKLELTQRLRSTKWKIALIVWFVVVGGICLLISAASSWGASYGDIGTGPLIFGLNVIFILFLGLLVTPTLSSGAINGDRNAGTLAILQVTMLTPVEIALGKIAAGWAASLAFLAVSIPFMVWAFFAGDVRFLALVTTLVILALLLLVVCAVSLAFSSLVTKTSGSALLSYLAVSALALFTLILFSLTLLLVTDEDVEVTSYRPTEWDNSTGEVLECELETYRTTLVHTERTWWLLAINPFVIVADAAPGGEVFGRSGPDPLAGIRDGVRTVRVGANLDSECAEFVPVSANGYQESDLADLSPVWPWGLAFHLLLGAGALFVTVRRIRIPQRKLARGTRVA